jgi:hypothetical protein
VVLLVVPPGPDVVLLVLPPGVVVLLVVVVVQSGRVMVLVSRVTEPLRARRRPWMSVPVVAVMEVSAMTVPTMVEAVPRVAELPTCQ